MEGQSNLLKVFREHYVQYVNCQKHYYADV